MYWLVVEVQGEIGLISLQERYLDERLEKNPDEIVFYAELTAEIGEWNYNQMSVSTGIKLGGPWTSHGPVQGVSAE